MLTIHIVTMVDFFWGVFFSVNALDCINEQNRLSIPLLIQSPAKEEKPEEEDARKVETRDASPELAEVPSEPEKKIIKLSSAAPKAALKTKLKEGKKSKEEKKGDAAEKEKKQAAVAVTETKGYIVF